MKLILDTNIWRYLVDSSNKNNLYKYTQDSKLDVFVPPGVVIETLRMGDKRLRKEIIELQTRNCWERLMPDAYLQSKDVMNEMLRFHPEWRKQEEKNSNKRRHRYNWIRGRGGFWEKVRRNTEIIAEKYYSQDKETLELVQKQSKDVRSDVLKNNRKIMETKSLHDIKGSWENKEGEEIEVDWWRVYAQLVWANLLSSTKSPFWEWTHEEINLDLILSYYALAYVEFWEKEAEVEKVPREWIRAAVYALQSEKKVTTGNPTDSLISVHLVDVDLVVSADKNFISIVNQIHKEAPFKTAKGFLVEAGCDGIDNLFHMIKTNFVESELNHSKNG